MHSADTKACQIFVHSKLSLFFSVPQKTAANQYCTSRLESVANLPVAVQANCAPCLALSESVCQRPHDGFGLELRTPAKLSTVESCILQGLFIAHLGCLAIPINCLVATDCIKTHQRSEGTSGSRRRQETRAEVQSRYFKDAYNKDAYDATLQQGSKRDSPGRTRQSRQLPARSCLQESCGLLRMQDAHASF